MSSIAKTSISLSKKDLTKSRIPPIGTRNVVFYHKATAGDLSVDLLSLVLPSAEMPNAVQATPDELSSARLTINKKNLNLVSSTKGQLIQNLDYLVVDSSTISLIGPYEGIGAEVDEIFVGTIVSVPISDLVTASSKNVVRSYTLPVGQATLNIAQEFKVNDYPSENIGIIKVFVNGLLAFRNTGNSSTVLDKDYYEVDSGNGFGTTIVFNVAPVTLPHNIVVDFGVQAITDFNAIGTIESLSGSVKKIADDLAVIAGTSANDYIMANPSDVERRAFGDTILSLDSKYDTTQNLSEYTKTKWQEKNSAVTGAGIVSAMTFNNLQIGKTYRISAYAYFDGINFGSSGFFSRILNGGVEIPLSQLNFAHGSNDERVSLSLTMVFISTGTNLQFDCTSFNGPPSSVNAKWILEELPNHEVTTQWT